MLFSSLLSVAAVATSFALVSGQATINPQLVHVGDIHLDVGTTYPSGKTPQGTFVFVPILGGTFNTTGYAPSGYNSTTPLEAQALPGGGDYAQIRSDGSIELQVSGAFKGVNVPNLFHYTAVGVIAPGSGTNNTANEAFGVADAWQVVRINTDSAEYGWMNSAALVGQERIVGANGTSQAIE